MTVSVRQWVRRRGELTMPKREADLSKLPLEIVEYELSEEERVCPGCGEQMRAFGADTRDEIKIIPARVVHLRHRCHVYKCAGCAKVADKTPIVKASNSGSGH